MRNRTRTASARAHALTRNRLAAAVLLFGLLAGTTWTVVHAAAGPGISPAGSAGPACVSATA